VSRDVLVGIETGGTKIMLALADAAAPDTIVAQHRIPTEDPRPTLAAMDAWIREAVGSDRIVGVGIGAFGPINLDPDSPDFTRLTVTPKLAWRGTRLLDGLPVLDGVPLRAVTDVGAAAIGEQQAGAGQGLSRLAYVTIGTGVGAGVLLNGRAVVGTGDHELGHQLVRKHPEDTFAGQCPYHGDCLEGLSCGPALQARYGIPAETFSPEQQAATARFVGDYAAQLAWTLRMGFSVQRVIFGGGVLHIPGLLDELRDRVAFYADGPIATPDGGEFIVQPQLGGEAGMRGALTLAAWSAAGSN